MKRRMISMLLAVAMLLGLATTVFADSSFSDVPSNTWYSDPVAWAVEKGITTGTGNGKFSPDASCTRAQVVTFLWRSQGEPAPKSNANPFSDVKSNAYYYNAVLWAVENGITTGTGGNQFSPEMGCTRAQVVTFLWRSQGQPAPKSTANPFSDVQTGAYYYNAVLWAVENEITTGMSATKFAPDDQCTRAHVVTFLWRACGKPALAVWYGEGMYCVGTDIPAGDYYAVATYSGYSGYYCKYTDSSQDHIEDNDNFDTWTYFRAYEGQYLKLNRCKITSIQNAPTNLKPTDGYYGVGMYRIGVDIPAGEYKFIATESGYSGYYCGYTDITYEHIDDNDNFDTTAFYTVTNGQYLQVHRAKFELIAAAPDDGDHGGNENEDDSKYSYDEARELNDYAKKATAATTSSLQYLNKSYDGMNAVRAMYVNQAVYEIQTSMRYLAYSLEILEANVPLEYSSGDHATVTDVVRECYALLDAVDELQADESNYEEVRNQIMAVLVTAGGLNLKFQKATVDLLDAFT